MKRLFTTIQIFCSGILIAQTSLTPATSTGPVKDNAWELGVHAGHLFSNGNIDFTPGYGGGIHIRRALDYVFSLRLDLMYGNLKGEDSGNIRSFDTNWKSGSLQLITSLNNLKWNPGERKTNIYAFGGLGLNSFSVEQREGSKPENKIPEKTAMHGEIGAGIAFRINNRVNFGIEHKAGYIFGERSDELDGVKTLANIESGRSSFRDVLNYTSVRLNINLGNLSEKTEPLYWLNPLDAVINDMNRLKDTRVTLTDSDGDGVIDMLDEEENTPQGAIVNVKGITLDSDGDGIADYLDKEPFSPSGYKTDAEGVAQVPDPMVEMRRYVDEKLRNFTPTTPPAPVSAGTSVIFMPNIYFPLGNAAVPNQQWTSLANVAQTIKNHPDLRFTVTGHTDERGDETANLRLSYRRAETVVRLLTEKFRINRNQLVLRYEGESTPLVPGAAEINRRVSFNLAPASSTDMPAPK